MPRMDQASTQERLIKLLLIGDGKIGKTRYAGMAAAAGFNVLYMDGDVGAQTLGMLPPEAQRRIYMMDVGDSVIGGFRDHKFLDNFVEFSNNVKVRWNDSKQRIASRLDKGDEIWEIQPGMMGSDTVFVLDSWTGLTESMTLKAMRANNIINVENAKMSEMRPVYQSAGLMATTALQLIRALNCHVIVIAHPDEFTHYTKPEGRRVSDAKENDLIIDWTKMVPKSTSKPHGLQMCKYFSDVAWMDVNPAGTERKLDFRLKPSRVGGGHFHEHKTVDDYAFDKLVKQVGGSIPDPKRPIEVPNWLSISRIPLEDAPVESKVLDGTKPAPVQGAGKGIAHLFAQRPTVAG